MVEIVSKIGEVAVKAGETTGKIIEKVDKINEINLNEVVEGKQVLEPDMETIKSQSLESIVQANIEKTTELTDVPDIEFRALSEEELIQIKEDGILSEDAIAAIRVGEDGVPVLKCRNEVLAGQVHDVSGVFYTEKTIDVGTLQVKVVVPEFPFKFKVDIPKEIWNMGDEEIFKFCTENLKEAIQANPELAKQFNAQQLEQIMDGSARIKGFSWHHSEIPGRMELVDTKVHAQSGHTGGNFIWCNGIR